MKEKVQDPNFRERLIAYLEDIIKEDLDDFKDIETQAESVPSSSHTSPRLTTDSLYAALRTMDITNLEQNRDHSNPSTVWSTPVKGQLSPSIPYASPVMLGGSPSNSHRSWSIPYASPRRNELLQTPTSDRSILDINVPSSQLKLFPACLPTPNPSSPNFKARFRADVVLLVEVQNTHCHTDTCYKYYDVMSSGKRICRLRLPRKLVPKSMVDPETGDIRMRRSHPMINNFNEYIISACRSNMDIKFIWTGSDAKALVYYITDYVTKSSLSFHDTFSLIQKNVTSLGDMSNQTDGTESATERSRKFVLRCYNTLASQQELSGVQVASYLMNWNDHYTTHKFQGLYLIQTELYLQSELNELRVKQNLETNLYDVIDDNNDDDDNVHNDENAHDINNNEENFQIQSTENENGKSFVLVNARIDYQCRSHTLDNVCLYDFVSAFYKKKINAADLKYLSDSSITQKEQDNRRGRPPNQRFPFQKHHPQVTTYLMMKHTEYRVPILYGPQIPRRDREDTRERYCRAI
ncbi:unnamed protein product, partial [Adineta ricciae]